MQATKELLELLIDKRCKEIISAAIYYKDYQTYDACSAQKIYDRLSSRIFDLGTLLRELKGLRKND